MVIFGVSSFLRTPTIYVFLCLNQFSQQLLSSKHSYHAFAISELDSLREESGSVSYRVGFLGEFKVAKRALKMAYTLIYCSATTLLEFSSYKTFFRLDQY